MRIQLAARNTIVATLLLTSLVLNPTCWAEELDQRATSILELARSVSQQETSSDKERLSYQVYEEIKHLVDDRGEASVPVAVIDELISLLGDNSTAHSACMALTELGVRARRAVPALQREIDGLEASDQTSSELLLEPPLRTVDILRGCLREIESR